MKKIKKLKNLTKKEKETIVKFLVREKKFLSFMRKKNIFKIHMGIIKKGLTKKESSRKLVLDLDSYAKIGMEFQKDYLDYLLDLKELK